MTAQIHEILIFEGEVTSMAYCPPIPIGHPRIIEVDLEKADSDNFDDYILFSSACWREYQGKWEIKDGLFYLVDLRGKFQLLGKGPLLADWFSGVIRVPRGKMLKYIHMGFESVYEQEVHVKIEKGKVISSKVINN